MTAEIAIINRQGIALAADSAVTVGREKVWKTANKLFSLGPTHDIAIMIYGSGDFLAYPWDVVIKEFRKHASSFKFEYVNDCVSEFRNFLLSAPFDNEIDHIYSVLFPIMDIMSELAVNIEKESNPSQYIASQLQSYNEEVDANPVLISDLNERTFRSKLRDSIKAQLKRYLGQDLANEFVSHFVTLTRKMFERKYPSAFASGIVIAGFGKLEYLPCLYHYKVDGRLGDQLKWWAESDCANLNDRGSNPFPVIPFAQQDMAFQFLTGVSTHFLNLLNFTMSGIMEGAINSVLEDYVSDDEKETAKEAARKVATHTAGQYINQLRRSIGEDHFNPIGTAVRSLPKEELAAMAEALVDITSLKRRVDSPIESVGGPVDVAVISKGDGFVWIKRKHYFDIDRNIDFPIRRNKGLANV